MTYGGSAGPGAMGAGNLGDEANGRGNTGVGGRGSGPGTSGGRGISMTDQAKAGLTGPQAAALGAKGVSSAADTVGGLGGGFGGGGSDLFGGVNLDDLALDKTEDPVEDMKEKSEKEEENEKEKGSFRNFFSSFFKSLVDPFKKDELTDSSGIFSDKSSLKSPHHNPHGLGLPNSSNDPFGYGISDDFSKMSTQDVMNFNERVDDFHERQAYQSPLNYFSRRANDFRRAGVPGALIGSFKDAFKGFAMQNEAKNLAELGYTPAQGYLDGIKESVQASREQRARETAWNSEDNIRQGGEQVPLRHLYAQNKRQPQQAPARDYSQYREKAEQAIQNRGSLVEMAKQRLEQSRKNMPIDYMQFIQEKYGRG